MDDQIAWLEQFCEPTTRIQIGRCHRHIASEHWHFNERLIDDHVFYYVMSGQISAIIDGQSQRWSAGQAAWLSPQVLQEAKVGSDDRLQFFTLRVHLSLPSGGIFYAPFPARLLTVAASVLGALDDCADLVRLTGPFTQQRLRYRLADCFAQMFAAEHAPQVESGLNHDQRRAVQNWLVSHLAHNPEPADLCAQTDLSSTAFRRRFRRTFGCSPRSWISSERLRLAGELLLESQQRIEEVASECGYESTPSFTRLFVRHYGCSPREWRQHADRVAQRPGPRLRS